MIFLFFLHYCPIMKHGHKRLIQYYYYCSKKKKASIICSYFHSEFAYTITSIIKTWVAVTVSLIPLRHQRY